MIKKYFLSACVTLLLFSFGNSQNETCFSSSVTVEEYETADSDLQRMINLVDASIGALNGFSLNAENTSYTAVVAFSLVESAKDSNYVLLAKNETTTVVQQSCKACGIRTGIACYKKIKAYMEASQLNEIDLHVSIGSDGCGTVSW